MHNEEPYTQSRGVNHYFIAVIWLTIIPIVFASDKTNQPFWFVASYVSEATRIKAAAVFVFQAMILFSAVYYLTWWYVASSLKLPDNRGDSPGD